MRIPITFPKECHFLLVLVLLGIALAIAFNQNGRAIFPEVEWNVTYGGFNDDVGYQLQPSLDGGYLVAGTTERNESGGLDIILVKWDSKGQEEWNTSFGGSNDDEAFSLDVTDNGNIIITGYTNSYGDVDGDVWLICLDQNGTELWNGTYGGWGDDIGYSVTCTNDGGYCIAGEKHSVGNQVNDLWVIKVDSNGTEEWNTTKGGKSGERANSIRQTNDNGYIISGWKSESDAWIVKLLPNGSTEWQRTWVGSPSSSKGIYSIEQTNDGGYIATGFTYAGNLYLWILKLYPNGSNAWSKRIGGGYTQGGNSILQTPDRGYIVVGDHQVNETSDRQGFLVKTDSIGEIEVNEKFGGFEDDIGYSIIQVNDSEYAFTGYSVANDQKDIWIVKIQLNYSPFNPPSPNGTVDCYSGRYYSYTVSTADPEDDDIRYILSWGDDDQVITPLNPSGESINVTILWDTPGMYSLRVRAEDVHGSSSNWSEALLIDVAQGNVPPNKPSKPICESTGYVNYSFVISTSSYDLNGDDIRYIFDWGDGTNTTTTYYNSNAVVNITHCWETPGIFSILIQAEDINGTLSEYSDTCQIHIKPLGVPEQPENFEAISNISNVCLFWTPPRDDGGLDVLSFHVFRGMSQEDMQLLSVTNGTTYEYNDTAVIPDQGYWYYVIALNELGQSNRSTMTWCYVPESNGNPVDGENKESDYSTILMFIFGVILISLMILLALKQLKRL